MIGDLLLPFLDAMMTTEEVEVEVEETTGIAAVAEEVEEMTGTTEEVVVVETTGIPIEGADATTTTSEEAIAAEAGTGIREETADLMTTIGAEAVVAEEGEMMTGDEGEEVAMMSGEVEEGA